MTAQRRCVPRRSWRMWRGRVSGMARPA